MVHEPATWATDRSGPWIEVGDRVFARRYRFFEQQIGLVLGDGEALVVDTRTTGRQAAEILVDIREVTPDPVAVVVNTHWHFDHRKSDRSKRRVRRQPWARRIRSALRHW